MYVVMCEHENLILSVSTETRKVVCYACPYSLANLPPPTESKGEIYVHYQI